MCAWFTVEFSCPGRPRARTNYGRVNAGGGEPGQLEIIGGVTHSTQYTPALTPPLLRKLPSSSHVQPVTGLLPYHELVRAMRRPRGRRYVMPNVERELAFPSRTVNYLWCGLPVIHPEFSEVAHYIREYEAGWVSPTTIWMHCECRN